MTDQERHEARLEGARAAKVLVRMGLDLLSKRADMLPVQVALLRVLENHMKNLPLPSSIEEWKVLGLDTTGVPA